MGTLAGGALAAACGAGGGATPGGEAGRTLKSGITLQWTSSDSGQARVVHHQQQAKLFEQKFPGIKVEVVPDGENLDKIRAGIAAGTPMDLISIGVAPYPVFALQGALVTMDALIKRDKYDLNDFFPLALRAWQWRGKLWALPFMGVLTPYLNLKVVEEAGARRPPTSWNDRSWDWNAFLEFGRKTTRREGDRTAQWGFIGPVSNVRLALASVWANGGDVFSSDGTRLTLGEPAAVEGLQFYSDLMNRHRIMASAEELSAIGGQARGFQDGKAAISVNSVGSVANFRQIPGLRWTVTALPRGSKGAYIGGGGSGWAMIASAKNQDETWELLKLVESPESDRMQALGGHAPPGRRSVARDPEYLTPKEAPGSDMKLVVEALETALRVDTPLVNGAEVYKIITDELAQSWAGKRSVQDSLTALKPRVEPLLAAERA
jgi:multiple sugar transport system substrate-binding protein